MPAGNVVWQDPVTAARAMLKLSHSRREMEDGIALRKMRAPDKQTDQQMDVDEKEKPAGVCCVCYVSVCVCYMRVCVCARGR